MKKLKVRVLNPDFKYVDTRKPNKNVTPGKLWVYTAVNRITMFNEVPWSLNAGRGVVKTDKLPKKINGTFTPYHG